jgi:hypothetical protein
VNTKLVAPEYVASFPSGSRVRLVSEGSPDFNKIGTVVRILENPTHNPDHQWYDIRIDETRLVRCREPFLKLDHERVVTP